MSDYVEMLAYFGVSGAHPGGIELTKTMIEHLNLASDDRILDVGCGTGQTAAYLGHLGYEVEAIDTHPLMIEKPICDSSGNNYLPCTASIDRTPAICG